MKVKDNAKKTVKTITNMKMKITKMVKFFSTIIGKIVLFIIAILILALLVYIIASVIMKSLGKLLGIDTWMQSDSDGYAFLRDLKQSGYTSMLSAEELVEYHSFEYAVLMDAARYMEENGTEVLNAGENSNDIPFDTLSWEEACEYTAESFNSNKSSGGSNDNDANGGDSNGGNANGGDSNGDNANGGNSNKPKQFAKNDLVFYSVYNEYTKEYSLVPYLEIVNNYDILTYYFEHTNGNTPDMEFAKAGMNAFENPDNFGNLIRFVSGNVSSTGATVEEATNYMVNHIRPVSIKVALNSRNFGAYKLKDAVYGAGPSEIDLYTDYAEGLYFETDRKPFCYRIPLRVLLDRFLPNASLLAAWNILSDEQDNNESVVDKIQKIYSEACLSGETISGDQLLVKDVYTVSTNVDENTDASDLFEKVILREKKVNEYIDGTATTQLYGSYSALFDSRVWRTNGNTNNGSPVDPPDNDPPDDEPSDDSGQKFPADFSGDLIDDIKLAIAHYVKDNNITIEQTAYNRLIQDVGNVIRPDENNPISEHQYIIYTPSKVENEYLVYCKGMETRDANQIRQHYDLQPNTDISDLSGIRRNCKHIYCEDPYNASAEAINCFVPFMKIAFTHDNGLRETAVIFQNDGTYSAYIIKENEIEDYRNISNNHTFAIFESNIIKSTTFREWSFVKEGSGGTKVSWIVTDAFEGMGVDFGLDPNDTVEIKIQYKLLGDEEKRTKTIRMKLQECLNRSQLDMNGFGEKALQSVIKQLAPNAENTANAVFSANQTAIIRTPADPLSRNYEGLLNPIQAASPNAEAATKLTNAGYTNFYSNYLGEGEASYIEMPYINLKALGLTADTTIDVDAVKQTIKERIVRLIKDSINVRPLIMSDIQAIYGDMMPADVKFESINVLVTSLSVDPQITFSAVFPTRIAVSPISQVIEDRSMPFYLVKEAITWSGKKQFHNHFSFGGRFNNRNAPGYLISNNHKAKGLLELNVEKEVDWRCKMFAPIFAGSKSENSKARETDVLLVLSKWQELSDEGINAADHYIRDLYSLIQYSKGIKSGDEYVIEPTYKEDGTPYIHPGSYEYLYIPDEILLFDDTTSEKAFWLDRLLVTPEDTIDESRENYLRSKTPTFTWQIVDYDLYDECVAEDGTASVYALWPYGSQYSRSLYAFAANASAKEAQKVGAILPDGEVPTTPGWGGYSAAHPAADLYGRASASKIYRTAFPQGNAVIKAKYENGKVTLTGVENTGSEGLYFSNTATKIRLGDHTYTFKGTAAAVYGYELYRQTLILKNPEKAEDVIRKQLEEEMTWTKICAVAPGIVEYVKGDAGSGFTVAIRHTDNFRTTYCHMKRFPLVQKGQYVGAGTVLGYEGTTGKSKGMHLHTSFGTLTKGDNPTYYLYPFFTPFYYEEKATEVDYSLSSEYMSTVRTVFPYGQYPENASAIAYNTELDKDGTIKIKNYTPYKAITDNASELLNEDSGYENYVDYSKLPTKNVRTNLGESNYKGEIIKTNPDYFDLSFIAGVQANNDRIKGAVPTTPWMITEPKGGFTDAGGWQYAWSYSPLREKPILAVSTQLDSSMYTKYNEELKRQVAAVGRGTRGAAVVAARFLAGFPYAIPYHGGQSFDGNLGYYGHYGISQGWGRTVVGGRNGIDCTGFINWCLINAYVEPEGSRMSASTNGYNAVIGKRTYTFREAYNLGIEIKPGDFYHVKNENYDPNADGGRVWDPDSGNIVRTGRFTHIGMIIGLDEQYIYVAESLGSVKISKLPRISNNYYVTINDNLYSGEGNYDKSEILPNYFKTGN